MEEAPSSIVLATRGKGLVALGVLAVRFQPVQDIYDEFNECPVLCVCDPLAQLRLLILYGVAHGGLLCPGGLGKMLVRIPETADL